VPQANAFQMGRRRAVAAEIKTAVGNHSFRAPDRDDRLSEKWRDAGARRDDGEPYLHPHHRAL